MSCFPTEAHAAHDGRVSVEPGAARALRQQEMSQGVRHGPARPLVHAMQVEESLHALRGLARAQACPHTHAKAARAPQYHAPRPGMVGSLLNFYADILSRVLSNVRSIGINFKETYFCSSNVAGILTT